MNKVCVIVATFNGEKYIGSLVESLLNQDFCDVCLLFHDDGSIDSTLSIIKGYASAYPKNIHLLDDGVTFGSAARNFSHLLELVKSPYVMFCDQDDVWDPEKIKLTYERMRKVERTNAGLPVLVHSDLRVVNGKANIVAESLFKYQKLPTKVTSIYEAMVINNVTGCTVMLNRAAINIAMPIPEEAIMHDWWIACRVLQNEGVISFIDQPLVDYRQHETNTIGAHKTTFFSYMRKALSPRSAYGSYRDVRRQARAMGVEIGPFKFARLKARILFKK